MRVLARVPRAQWAGALVAAVVFVSPGMGAQAPSPRTVKPVLHGRHWVAITGKPLGATAGARLFQQGGNAVDAACAMLGAVATMWDTLGWGGETQALIYHPQAEEGDRHQRARRRPDGRHARVLPRQEDAVSARVRAAGGRDARHARRPDGDARRVRHEEPRRGPRPGHRDGRRLPDRAAGRRRHRTPEARDQEVALVGEGVPAPRRAGARSAVRRGDLQAGRSRGDAAEARGRRAAGARGREEPEGRDLRGARPVLQGRHRAATSPRARRNSAG